MKLNFQTVLLIIFGVGILAGVLIFAGIIPIGSSREGESIKGLVTIWGTGPGEVYGNLAKRAEDHHRDLAVKYVEKSPETFNKELTRALAEGTGPDLFFVTNDTIVEHRNKAFLIPFETYPSEVFHSRFVDEAELFIDSEGIVAFPFLINPMVMYYNKDLLRSSFIIDPPEFWDELFTFAPQVTTQTDSGAIEQSAVAFGTFNNIPYMKDLFSLIMLQSGNRLAIFGQRETDDRYISTFAADGVALSVLRFITVFSNPAQDAYSWNPSLSSALDAFLTGDLALYFGYASELSSLRDQNPNLNFDIALMPQTRDGVAKVTHGRITGLALSKNSENIQAAFAVADLFSGNEFGEILSEQLLLPTVQKDLLRQKPTEAFRVLFNNSALIARSWLDPEPIATDRIVRDMIQDTVSGAVSPSDAVRRADASLSSLFESS